VKVRNDLDSQTQCVATCFHATIFDGNVSKSVVDIRKLELIEQKLREQIGFFARAKPNGWSDSILSAHEDLAQNRATVLFGGIDLHAEIVRDVPHIDVNFLVQLDVAQGDA
jgi:hypothetical protein